MVQRQYRYARVDPDSLRRARDERLRDRRMQIVRARQREVRMRNDEMLRHRDHVVTQLVGVLDHRRLLRSGHGELPVRRHRRQLKRVRQRECQFHPAMMAGQQLPRPVGGLRGEQLFDPKL